MPLLTLLLSALLFSPGAGQLHGRVLTQQGAPRGSGEVFFFSPAIPKLRKAQLLRVPLDSKGHFTAALLPRRLYLCWSVSKDGSGRIFLSGQKHEVQAGMHLVLKEVYVRKSKRLRLRGLHPWAHPRDLSLVWKLGEGQEFVTQVDKHGNGSIPDLLPFSRGAATFVVQKKSGLQLFAVKVSVLGLRGKSPFYQFPCPKPELRSFTVVDGRPGKNQTPVSGARVFFRMDEERWLRGPLSDEKGEVHLQVPALGGLYSYLFFSASKVGFGRGYARISQEGVCAGGEELRDAKSPLLLPLLEEAGRAAKFLGFDGKGLPGVLMVGDPTVLVKGARWGNNETMEDRPLMGWSDTHGQLRLRGLSTLVNYLQYRFFLPKGVWEKVLPPGYSFPPPFGLFCSVGSSFPGSPNRVFGLNLRKYQILPFTIEGADGSPIPFAKLQFLGSQNPIPMQFLADRKGRGSAFLGKTGGALIAFGPDQEYFFQTLGPSSEEGGRMLEPRVLRMKPVTTFVTGKVQNARGKGLPGVHISIRSSSRGPLPEAWGFLKLNEFFLHGVTDAQGRFKLPFLPHPGLIFRLEFTLGDRSARLKVDSALRDVVIQL